MDIKYDLYRIKCKYDIVSLLITFMCHRGFRYVVYYRLRKKYSSFPFFGFVLKLFSHMLNRKMSVEIPTSVEIGKGLLLIHPHSITINSKSIIGDNFTILKGATIGNIKQGSKQGSPIIGNNVYVGPNSTIVGGVKIGNNVLIAPNTFVNFNVPDDSLVVGSPGIIHSGHSSEGYILNTIKNIM